MAQKNALENIDATTRLASDGFLFLPHELITEILSWSPVRSLLKFKCVCKLWRATIQEERFVNKHKNRSTSYDVYKTDPHNPITIPFTTPVLDRYDVVRSINGLRLECHMWTDEYCVRNPSTKQVIHLPRSQHYYNRSQINMIYISSTNEYKLINVYCDQESRPLGCEVLNIGSDMTWKPLDFPKLKETSRCVGIRDFEGVLYVVVYHTFDDVSQLICLEIQNELFVILDVPIRFFQEGVIPKALLWNGKFVLCYIANGELQYAWVLEDYKKQKWVENKIGINTLMYTEGRPLENLQITMANDGMLRVLVNMRYEIYYDIKSLEVTRITKVPPRKIWHYTFTPTLVSLKGMQTENILD